jgi:hypothetical protein
MSGAAAQADASNVTSTTRGDDTAPHVPNVADVSEMRGEAGDLDHNPFGDSIQPFSISNGRRPSPRAAPYSFEALPVRIAARTFPVSRVLRSSKQQGLAETSTFIFGGLSAHRLQRSGLVRPAPASIPGAGPLFGTTADMMRTLSNRRPCADAMRRTKARLSLPPLSFVQNWHWRR